MEPITTLIGLVLGVPIVLGIACFVWNVCATTGHNIRTALVRKARVVIGGDRADLLRRLPRLRRPASSFTRVHARILLAETPSGGPEVILWDFERALIEMQHRCLFFARIKSPRKDAVCSAIVGFRASRFTRFFGWVEIEPLGTCWEWRIVFSETRFMRTPSEEDSHFEFSPLQHERYKTADESAAHITFLWDALTSNLTTQEMSVRAGYFERLLREAFLAALDGSAVTTTGRRLVSPMVSGSTTTSPRARIRPPRRI